MKQKIKNQMKKYNKLNTSVRFYPSIKSAVRARGQLLRRENVRVRLFASYFYYRSVKYDCYRIVLSDQAIARRTA